MLRTLALIALCLGPSALSQSSEPKRTQANADGSITFRLMAPGASSVSVNFELSPKPLPMTRGSGGLWWLTTPRLAPEYYNYAFVVDGVAQLDPFNRDTLPNFLYSANEVLVPGHPPAAWELTDVPHGRVDRHGYTTHIVRNLPANQSAYVVYTPPGYDEHRKGGYPVLYLLHGWSDNETSWSAVGRANLILDRLIAAGKAVPMIVVMPLGYGNLDFVTRGHAAWDDPARVHENVKLNTAALLGEVLPAVEREYNVAPGRDNRALAGLSMGGQESLYAGLNHTQQFAWIGSMSAALKDQHFDTEIPSVRPKQANLRLLWVACGQQDALLAPNQAFIAWARGKGLKVTAVETPLAHVWLTWRDNLIQLAPLLFQPR